MPTVPTQVGEQLPVLAVAPSREECLRRMASVALGRLRRPVVGLGIAGAYGPPRPDSARAPHAGRRHTRAQRARWRGQWRDAHGVRFSLLDGARIVHGLRWHHGHSAEHLGEARKQIQEAGVIPDAPVRLGVVCDGAAWIGQHVQPLWPHARQGRDADHWAQALQRVATAHAGASGQAVEGVEATRTRLSRGTGGVVLGGVRRMPAQSDDADKGMTTGWASLDAPRGRTTDRHRRRGGEP